MKGLKFAILVVGLVGVVASFLPFVGDLSFWKYAEVADRAAKAYLVVGGFGLAALMALLAAARGGLARVHGVFALVGFAATLLPEEVRQGFDVGTLAGKLLLVCAAIGVLLGLVAVVKPEP